MIFFKRSAWEPAGREARRRAERVDNEVASFQFCQHNAEPSVRLPEIILKIAVKVNGTCV